MFSLQLNSLRQIMISLVCLNSTWLCLPNDVRLHPLALHVHSVLFKCNNFCHSFSCRSLSQSNGLLEREREREREFNSNMSPWNLCWGQDVMMCSMVWSGFPQSQSGEVLRLHLCIRWLHQPCPVLTLLWVVRMLLRRFKPGCWIVGSGTVYLLEMVFSVNAFL